MNKTKIDWCDSTWNPVTGCLHRCEYCYARDIARRFGFHANEPDINKRVLDECPVSAGKKVPYPFDFQPTFHRYRLNDYAEKQGRNIFVCSMADLFGTWVPVDWEMEVFEACKRAPQHNYLFLTKNPGRYGCLELGGRLPRDGNMWYGATITNIRQMKRACEALVNTPESAHVFFSVEPLLEDISSYGVWSDAFLGEFVDWVIIGAETGRRKNKIVPKRRWVEGIVYHCKCMRIPVFMKSSLSDIWGEPLIQEFPEGLKKGSSYTV